MRRTKLTNKNMGEAAGAFAGLSAAVTAAVKVALWWFAPTGFAAVLVALGLRNPPLIVKLAPFVLAFCLVMGGIAGFARFISWLRPSLERP